MADSAGSLPPAKRALDNAHQSGENNVPVQDNHLPIEGQDKAEEKSATDARHIDAQPPVPHNEAVPAGNVPDDVHMELVDAVAQHDPNAPLQCELWAWGRCSEGQLGIGSSEDQMMPRLVPSLSQRKVVQVACGYDHTAVLTDAGAIYTFGSNEHGQLARSGREQVPTRLDVLETIQVRAVSCGQGWTACLGTKGEIITWGANDAGQLGDGTTTSRSRPRRVEGLSQYFCVQLRCGSKHAVALTASGDVFTWGEGFSGQLGNGTFIRSAKPVHVADLAGHPVRKVAAGEEHTVALTVSGDLWAWGSNKFFQLGVGDQRDRLRPTLISFLSEKRVTDVECGAQHTLFLTKQDRIYSVGAGSFGQLGHGSTEHEANPKAILELLGSRASTVACGRRHTLAVFPEADKVSAFGAGVRGQLGIGGAPSVKLLPSSVDVFKGRKVSAVYAGGESSFALISDYPVRKELAIARLTLKSIKDWIANNNISALQRQIEIVFSSFASLNASFIDENTVLGTNKSLHGLDLAAVREAYKSIFLSNPALAQTVGSCTARLVTRMRQLHYNRPEVLRFILIIMENPLLLNQAQYLPAIERLTEGILSLPPSAIDTLQQWWGTLPADYFSRVLQVLQGQLTYLSKNAIDRPITQAVMVLEKLHQVNEQLKLVPYTRFYNESISRCSDLEEDCKRYHGGTHIFSFCRYPFLLEPDAKSRILHIDAVHQQRIHFEQAMLQNLFAQQSSPYLVLTLERSNVVGHTLSQLAQKTQDLKKPLKVVFANEPAADEGGVTKEFFQIVVREIFDPNYALFSFIPETGEYYFNPHSLEGKLQFELIGTILGLAIYNNVILDVHFPSVVYKKLLGQKPTLDDLKHMQSAVGKGLQTLLDYTEDNVEEVFGLTFSITVEAFGEQHVHEFIPGGKDMPVTIRNRNDYVDAYVNYVLNESVEQQYSAFHTGFSRLMSGPMLSIFRPEELEVLTTGTDELDFHELEKVTQYKDYTKNSSTIKAFWETVHSLTPGQRRDLLRFSTGCVRAPILGLSSLPFFIQRSGGDSDRLPAAHTCFNILDLPEYATKEKMREKLLVAISNAEGFGLQ